MSTTLLVSSKDFIDVDISFAKHPTSKNILLKKNVNSVKQSVLHLLRLRSGDVPFHPELKSPIYDFFFENTTSITKIIIESEIIKYLAVFEPRLEVTEVVVTFPDNHSIDCKIVGNIVNISKLITINVLVDNNTSTPTGPIITVPSAPYNVFATLLPGNTTPSDPHFANVSLLLHCEGLYNSTSVIDSSPRPKIISSTNAPTFSNSLPKFGNSALYIINGIDNELRIPAFTSDLEFGSGDFTIETWVYPITFIGPVMLLEGQTDGVSSEGSSFEFRFGPGSNSRVYTDFAYPSNSLDYLCAGPNPNVGEWSHIAIVRSGANLLSFLNGVLIGSGSAIGSVNAGSPDYPNRMFKVDGTGQAMSFDGYIDDLRITKGVARYTSNFNIPTEQFLDQ